jgi:hypothetical protein
MQQLSCCHYQLRACLVSSRRGDERELRRCQKEGDAVGGGGHYYLELPQVGGLLLKNYGEFL